VPFKRTLAAGIGIALAAILVVVITWSTSSPSRPSTAHKGKSTSLPARPRVATTFAGLIPPATPHPTGNGKRAGAVPAAADLSTIAGHDLLPPCLPPGFTLPVGTQVTGLNATGGSGPCTASGGNFQVTYAQPQQQVIAFLRLGFGQPRWRTNGDRAATVLLYNDNGAITGRISAWKLTFVNNPHNTGADAYSAIFTTWTYHGTAEGNIAYVPPESEQAS
jgi:hypothetical protein